MPASNAEIARLFRELADLLDIQGANPFRVRAYRNAARVAEGWSQPLAKLAAGGPKALNGLPGIGADLAGKIEEIVRTGTFASLEEAHSKVPRGLLELLRVPNLGPKKARTLFDRLNVQSLADLEAAAREGKVRGLPGFSALSEAAILEELQTVHASASRVLRAAAVEYAEPLAEHLRSVTGVKRVELAGSYRRLRDTVGDIDILVTCAAGAKVVDAFTSWDGAQKVLASGPTKASIRLRVGLQVDLRVLEEESFGAGLHYFTGSQAHNVAMRSLALKQGLKLNEYGIFKGAKRLGGASEDEIFKAVGLPYIAPELREDRGEIECGLAGELPELIELADIRGDCQMHTVESDGKATLEEMASAAEELGYEYIAVTDHSPLLSMVQGLDAGGFRKQWARIEKLNAKLKKLTILRACEVDIHEDGTLDLPDDVLAEADLVVVSLHTKLKLPPKEQTARVLKALQHPSADIFGHPHGRKLLRREGAQFDIDLVCRAAAEHGVLMEVNSEPDRLDLDDISARIAVDRGAKLIISTDAHAPRELKFMRWGVDQARRAWATKKDVANTRSLAQFRKLLHKQK